VEERRLDGGGAAGAAPRRSLVEWVEPEPPPAWASTPARTLAECREPFERHEDALTLGLEEEVMLLDPSTLELSPSVEAALQLLHGDPRFVRELRSAQLEIVTRPAPDVHRVACDLAQARLTLAERLEPGLRFAAAGTHPWSTDWGDLPEGERYEAIAIEYPSAPEQALPCGMHVHVAVPGADRALAVYNALRSYLPELAALAANAPFFEGADTGLASVRPGLMRGMLRVGVPPAFATWDDLASYVSWGRRGGLFPDASHLWWLLRLHLSLGTLELRVFDAQTRVQDAVAIAGVCQALVADLARRHDAGERLTVHDTHRIAENDWRANRYGVRGFLVDLDTGRRVPTRERLAALLERLGPAAEPLGAGDALLAAATLVADAGADRQRYVAAEQGLDGLVGWLVRETRASAAELLAGETVVTG
jgi:glutamate---cysteine ligase / carboxylate-amine ligase